MGSVVHTVTDAVGLTDYAGAERREEAANKAANRVNQLTDKQLEFQRKQYEEWKSIYGDLQENLNDYYSNMTTDKYITQSNQQIEQQFNLQQKRLQQTLAQRGIDNSGIEAAAQLAMSTKLAEDKANVRMIADDYVNKQKMQFVGLGLGQGTQMLGTQAQVASAGIGANANISSSNTAASASMSNAAVNAIGGTVGSIVGAYGGYQAAQAMK